jgi:hypothetical protein
MADVSYYTRHIPTVLIYLAPVFCFLLLILILNQTNPLQTGPASILLVFVMLYLLVLTTLAAILHIVGAVWKVVRPRQALSLRRGYYMLSVVSIAPVLMVALNTLGQLEILEGSLILLLVSLGCFYILKRTAK